MFPDRDTLSNQIFTGWQSRNLPYDASFADTIAQNLVDTYPQIPHPVQDGTPQPFWSCAQVLAQVPMPSPAPEEGWLPLAYRYIKGKMFSDAPCFVQGVAPYKTDLECFLTVLQVVFQWEEEHTPFHPFLFFKLLTPEEYLPCDCGQEYVQFVQAYHQEFVYELMRLGDEVTPYKALGHMGGVHHIALTVARGLAKGGIPIDLALVSGSAMSHDFGKFGCRPGERVPYLHYYYTDQWLTKRGLDTMAHIAANHSTWDLELEALSAESLCLIYADFRSKQDRDAQGNEITKIYTLEDAFDVIFDKLDNVDGEKRRRYQLVYEKLRTFQDYLHLLGVDTQLTGAEQVHTPFLDPVLLSPDQTIRGLSLMSVEHNLKLMHLLSSRHQFGNLIESARSAKNWKQLRAYLDIFKAYFIYLSVPQKRQALALLYELLIHREGDIRRQASSLMGQMIAKFHLVYRKELPLHILSDPAEEVPFALWHQYLQKILYPDHRTTPTQRGHIGYTLKLVVGSLQQHGRPEDLPRFAKGLLRHFKNHESLDDHTALTLLDALATVSQEYYRQDLPDLIEKSAHFLARNQIQLTTAVLQFYQQLQLPASHPLVQRMANLSLTVEDDSLPIIFLQHNVMKKAQRNVQDWEARLNQDAVIGEAFLANLKGATPWVVKLAGIQLLQQQEARYHHVRGLHIATHFANLLKTSERVVIRHYAGAALVDLLPQLSRDQRYEVVVELGKGLEMGQLELTKYIPKHLGSAILFLHPTELDEQVAWLQSFLGSASDAHIAGALNTASVMLQRYHTYINRFPQDKERFLQRRSELLGILLQGLAHYREGVRQEALLVIGKLLDNPYLTLPLKAELFTICYRKLLFLMREGERHEEPLTFFFRASALGSINRFLALYQMEFGGFHIQRPPRVAFFPGTFDPFTLSHKEIAKSIRALGFEVYLAVDEFSWSKKAQPHLIRRQVVNISIAGEFHVHLFPFETPVNIANPQDIAKLTAMFPDTEVYLVVGSDVVQNASSYQKAPQPNSVHHLNHIIFRRTEEAPSIQTIKGDVIQLHLPPHLEDISSTRIRENVDLNRDISTFIDPVVQDYIYQNGLYLRDFQNKQLVDIPDLHFTWIDQATQEDIDPLLRKLDLPEQTPPPQLGRSLLVVTNHSKRPLGYLSYTYLQVEDLYGVFQDVPLVKGLRLRSSGKTLLITGLYGKEALRDYRKVLLTEVLAQACAQSCVYGVYYPQNQEQPITPHTEHLFERSGFLRKEGERNILEVNMRTPTVVIQNLETTIQEPLAKNPRVLDFIQQGHLRLQEALTKLYPGNLILSLSANIIQQRLLEKITAHHGVPTKPVTPRQLGDCMCVPYGKMLRGKIVPNTVTKAIHTDRVFSSDLSSHRVEAYPNYTPIPCQVRTIHSFQRPVILVDDLMHSGLRIGTLDGVLTQEEIDLSLVLVGVLTGHGRDVMDSIQRPVDSVYFLPQLERWFVESTLYPFIGGDTVEREDMPVPGLLPGINHLLPYESPLFQKDSSPQALHQFSLSCLESASRLMHVIEEEYRSLYGRNLTLSRLAEAVVLPLCPDKGAHLTYDPSLSPTAYLDSDLELMKRIAPKCPHQD